MKNETLLTFILGLGLGALASYGYFFKEDLRKSVELSFAQGKVEAMNLFCPTVGEKIFGQNKGK